jgi:hypothetical protein
VLLVAAVAYQFKGRPTVREQTTVAAARPVVDTAIRDLVTAAGPGPVIAVGGFVDSGACDVTPVRTGARYQREIDLYAAPGTESALLHSIADALPERYAADAGDGVALTLSADAGDFVAIVGSVPSPGHVEIRALTGCRPVGDLAAEPTPAATGPAAAEVADALAALKQPATPAAVVVACGVAGAETVSATVPRAGQLTLSALSAAPVFGSDTTIAYRDNGVDMVVRHQSDALVVTATRRC